MAKISVVRAKDASDRVWEKARALHRLRPDLADPMLGPGFARVVAELRRDAHLILAESGDELEAFWAVHIRPDRWARPIGGPFSDWQAPIVHPESKLGPTDLLSAAGLSGMSVSAYRSAPGEPCLAGERIGSHLTVLHRGHADWLATQTALFPRHFKKTRRLNRQLYRDFSKVEFRTDDKDVATIETIVRLKRSQFAATGRHDVLAPDWSKQLVEMLRKHDAEGISLRVASLYLDDRFAAGEVILQSDQVAHGWLTAYEAEFSQYSPSFLLVEAILEDLPPRGQSVYDAGPGQDYYKKYYTNVMVPADSGTFRTSRLVLAPTRLLGVGWTRLEGILPAPLSQLMGKMRRRTDQIVASESSTTGLLRGLTRAALRRPGS